MNKDQKARKALEWDKKEVYEADAEKLVKIMENNRIRAKSRNLIEEMKSIITK